MKRMSIAAASAAILACAPALAATPSVSGKYIVTVTKLCQMVTTYHFSSAQDLGNYLDGINTGGSSYKQSMYAASFSPAKGKVTIDGFDDGGDLEIFHFTGSIGGTQGEQMAQAPNSGKVAYSNGDTTITIGDRTYNALYGQVSKNGVAGYVAFQGVFASDTGNACTEQGIMQAQ